MCIYIRLNTTQLTTTTPKSHTRAYTTSYTKELGKVLEVIGRCVVDSLLEAGGWRLAGARRGVFLAEPAFGLWLRQNPSKHKDNAGQICESILTECVPQCL